MHGDVRHSCASFVSVPLILHPDQDVCRSDSPNPTDQKSCERRADGPPTRMQNQAGDETDDRTENGEDAAEEVKAVDQLLSSFHRLPNAAVEARRLWRRRLGRPVLTVLHPARLLGKTPLVNRAHPSCGSVLIRRTPCRMAEIHLPSERRR